MHKKILLVDNDDAYTADLAARLRNLGHCADVVKSGEEALRRADAPDVLVTSLRLKNGLDGLSLAKIMYTQWPSLKIIFVSSSRQRILREFVDIPCLICDKPVGLSQILDHIRADVSSAAG